MLKHWTRRHQTLALSIAAALTFVSIGVVFYIRNIAAERDRTDGALVRAESAKNAVIKANQATESAFNKLSLKNAELLLASDPSAAWDVLMTYRGADHDLAHLLRGKTEGLGIARVRVSAHKDSVTRLQALSDGTLLSVGEDGTIAVTTIDGNSHLLTSRAINHGVSSFSQTRELLAFACQTEGLCLLEPVKNSSRALNVRSFGVPDSLDFSPDGYQLAARYGDRLVVWDLRTTAPRILWDSRILNARQVLHLSNTHIIVIARERAMLIDIHDNHTTSLLELATSALARYEQTVILGDVKGNIWILETGKQQHRDPPRRMCEGQINAIAILQTKHVFAYACQDGNIGIASLADANKIVVHYHQDSPILSLATSADERYVVFGGGRGTMQIYDSAFGSMTSYHGQNTRLCTVSGPAASFPYFSSGDDNGYVRIWDAPKPISRVIIKARSVFHDTALLEDGTVVGLGGDSVLRWWKDGELGSSPAHEGGGIVLRRSPDLVHFATFGFDGYLILWSSSPIASVHRTKSGPLTNVVFLNDGQTIISSGMDGRLLLWGPHDDAPRVLHQFSQPLATVDVLRRDDSLVVAERGGSLWTMNPHTPGPPVMFRSGHGESISHLVTSDNSEWVAVGTSGGEVLIYPTATWKPTPVMRANGSIRVIVFSIDKTMLSVVSEDGFAYLLPTPDVSPANFTHWHSLELPARSVRFSPDKRYLAITTSNDGVFFYSLERKTWHYIPLPGADVFRGRFSRDGTRFATADGSGQITLFDLTQLVH